MRCNYQQESEVVISKHLFCYIKYCFTNSYPNAMYPQQQNESIEHRQGLKIDIIKSYRRFETTFATDGSFIEKVIAKKYEILIYFSSLSIISIYWNVAWKLLLNMIHLF